MSPSERDKFPQGSELFLNKCFDDAIEEGHFFIACKILDIYSPELLSESDLGLVRELLSKTADNMLLLDDLSSPSGRRKPDETFHFILGILENDCDFYSFSRIRELLPDLKASSDTEKRLLKSVSAEISRQENLYSPYENILRKYKSRDYSSVIKECRKILNANPQDKEAVLFLYRGQNNLKKINSISRILQEEKLLSDFDSVIYGLIDITRYLSRDSQAYKKIIDLIDVFITDKKKKFRLDELIEQGYKSIEKGDIETATKMAQKAIDLDKDSVSAKELLKSLQTVNNFEALLSRGKSLFYKGDFIKALDVFKQCVEITGKTSDLQEFIAKIETRLQLEDIYNRAIIYYRKEDWKNALNEFKKIMKKDKEYKKVDKLASNAKKKMELEELSQMLETALSANDIESAKVHLAGMKEIEPSYKAIPQLEERLNMSKDFNKLIKKAADNLEKKEFAIARQIAEQALDIDPTHNQALKLYKRIEEEEKIADILEKALHAFSEEKYDEIISLCRKGLLVQPDNKELRKLNETAKEQNKNREKLFEARALLAKDKLGEANKILTGLMSIDPDNKEASDLLARVENKVMLNTLLSKGLNSLQKKDLEGARIRFNEALKIEPSNKKIKEYLKKIDAVEKVKDKHRDEITRVTMVPVEKSHDKITELMEAKEFDIALAFVETILEENTKDEKIIRLKNKLEQILSRLDELEKEAIDTFQSGDYNSSLIKWKKLLGYVNPKSSRYQTIHLQFQGVLEAMSFELIQNAENYISKGNFEKARNTLNVLSKLPLEGIEEKAKEMMNHLK